MDECSKLKSNKYPVCVPFIHVTSRTGMDGDLYDEFGNYIGPELESDQSDEEERLPGDQDHVSQPQPDTLTMS